MHIKWSVLKHVFLWKDPVTSLLWIIAETITSMLWDAVYIYMRIRPIGHILGLRETSLLYLPCFGWFGWRRPEFSKGHPSHWRNMPNLSNMKLLKGPRVTQIFHQTKQHPHPHCQPDPSHTKSRIVRWCAICWLTSGYTCNVTQILDFCSGLYMLPWWLGAIREKCTNGVDWEVFS